MQRWTRASAPASAERETPPAALARLRAGNARYARDASLNCNRNYVRRSEVSAAQTPFAVILSCADSRVPPEIIFHQRLGDLFVIRAAGIVADALVLGSIEYAPAARRARLLPGNVVHDAVHENVVDVVAYIRKRSTITDESERRGALRSAGATYDLGTGLVTFLS